MFTAGQRTDADPEDGGEQPAFRSRELVTTVKEQQRRGLFSDDHRVQCRICFDVHSPCNGYSEDRMSPGTARVVVEDLGFRSTKVKGGSTTSSETNGMQN
ncbi:hypothetical protein L1987_42462 [Smallanthus sonchifolius]|uniref:Uncharacterized protein n=1 Tax=Smallanthus sonchifolius TaxID=185202 RepID=A0ACB9GIR0_9ASTR|nr:hypothetical protein L1987_42462 [Smallanthus sonchifolius]